MRQNLMVDLGGRKAKVTGYTTPASRSKAGRRMEILSATDQSVIASWCQSDDHQLGLLSLGGLR
jgi:hypothetical protein